MPDRDAVTCPLGDGYLLIAAGIRRLKATDDVRADLILENGSILYQDRCVLNSVKERRAWAAAAAQPPDGPTAARLEEALLQHVLKPALALLQEDQPKKPTQADLLVGMVSDLQPGGDLAADVAGAVELFHDPSGIPYATIFMDDHHETWLLHSKSFRQWMARRYHVQHGKTPNASALIDATAVLAGKAIFDGPEQAVHLRFAEHEGVIYLDLGNERWEAAAIDRRGWRIETNPPVKFRRSRGLLPLPTPVAGGSVGDLRQFLNLPGGDDGDNGDAGDDAAWILVVAWLIAAFRPRGPYPLLVSLGEQGSAKSTQQRVLRALIDPNKAPIRTMPRDERDLMIAATNGWCLAFDNLSHLQDWQSDTLCRISTGGGFAARELYSDQDETILDVQRPVMLNGIEEIVTRNDLLDRSIIVTLPVIPPGRRRSEKAFWREFEQARPGILGALLDAVSKALADEATVALAEHPRMADFAEWIVAAERALPWKDKPGAFIAAYTANRKDANDLTLEASPVAQAVRDLKPNQGAAWVGTATALLSDLEAITTEQIRKQKTWPSDGRRLSNALRRLAPNLRAAGLDIAFLPRTGRSRPIRIQKTEQEGNSSSSSSSSSFSAPNQRFFGDDEIGGDDAHRHPDTPSSPDSASEPAEWREESPDGDDGDAGDDEMHDRSEWGDDPWALA